MPDFRLVKVGQRVWSSRKGWGTVDGWFSPQYRFLVVFDSEGGKVHSYTNDGKYSADDRYPELHWDEVKYEEPEPPKKREAWVDFFLDDGQVILQGANAHAALYNSKEEALKDRTSPSLCYIDSPVKITWTQTNEGRLLTNKRVEYSLIERISGTDNWNEETSPIIGYSRYAWEVLNEKCISPYDEIWNFNTDYCAGLALVRDGYVVEYMRVI